MTKPFFTGLIAQGIDWDMDKDTLDQVAHLARLSLEHDNLATFTQQIQDVMKMVDQIQSIDTDGVAPLAHPLDLVQPLREDQVICEHDREHTQACAPLTQQGYYCVPPVIESN